MTNKHEVIKTFTVSLQSPKDATHYKFYRTEINGKESIIFSWWKKENQVIYSFNHNINDWEQSTPEKAGFIFPIIEIAK